MAAQRLKKSGPSEDLNYKSAFLKWPVLLLLGIYISSLIALLEYGCRRFPSSRDRRAIPSEWNVTAIQTAVLSAPLINRRARPTPRPGSTTTRSGSPPPSGTAKTSPPGHTTGHKLQKLELKRADNTTKIVAPAPNNGSAINTTLPLTFADRLGFSPYYLNHSRPNTSPGIRRRIPDPSHFGQLSGPTLLVTVYLGWWPHIDQAYSEIVYFPPAAWQALSSSDDGGPESLHPCWVTCDGPALVFHDTTCWDIWARLSITEKQAKATPGMAWRVREIENRVHKCVASRQTPTEDLVLVTTTWKPEYTDPADGHVSTSTTTDTKWELRLPEVTAVSKAIEVPVVSGFVTLTDLNGIPTSTSTIVGTDWILVSVATGIETDQNGNPTTTRRIVPTDMTVTLTNAALTPSPPSPTADEYLGAVNPFVTTETFTARDTNGVPVSTWTQTRPAGGIITVTDSLGAPIAIITPFSSPPGTLVNFPPGVNKTESESAPQNAAFHPVTRREYYIVSFVPILLAICLSIIAQMVSSSVRVLLPFHLLTRPGGVSAADSLAMSTGGIDGYFNSIRLLFKFGEPMSFFGDVLVIFSALVTALSSEAVGIKLHGSCAPNSFQGCYMGIAVFKEPSRALEGLLAFMLATLVLMTVLLSRWRTGVAFGPQSMAATASLIQDPSVRKLFREQLKVGKGWTDHERFLRQREIISRLDGQLFCLRYFGNPGQGGEVEYGITTIPQQKQKQELKKLPSPSAVRLTNTNSSNPKSPASSLAKARSWAIQSMSSIKVTVMRRRATKRRLWLDRLTNQPTADRLTILAGIVLLVGLIILISYYSTTSYNTAFERFMNSQSFGVEMLFAALGVILSFFWDYIYSQTTTLHPYHLLSTRPQPARPTLFLSPPLTPLTGLPSSIIRLEIYTSTVGFAALLSKFTPTLLSNIPFSPAQTWTMHLVCAWSSIAFLGFMLLVAIWVLISSFVNEIHLPVDVAAGSLAGRIWYLCWDGEGGNGGNRSVVENFAGQSKKNGWLGKRKGGVVLDLKGRRYVFGAIFPSGQPSSGSGEVRVGIQHEKVGTQNKTGGRSSLGYSGSGSDTEQGDWADDSTRCSSSERPRVRIVEEQASP